MRVLVLCHGNLNRSPLVAALIARERPDWDVVSAGLKAHEHRKAARKAREAAERLGLDLSLHRSQQVTLRALQDADVVLYMDNGNALRLSAMIADAPPRMRAGLERKCRALWQGTTHQRVPDPNFESDPDRLRSMFAVAEECALHTVRELSR